MHNDPFKERAPAEEDKRFRSLFGCGVVVAHKLWQLLNTHRLVPSGGTMTHLLWTLTFLKVHPSELAMKTLTGSTDNKTIRKWVVQFYKAIAQLELILVRTCLRNLWSFTIVSQYVFSFVFVEVVQMARLKER